MTIRHLKVLIAVADSGKMSTAAEKLFIAQPTVSQAIAEIEQHYGVKVFERLSKRLYLTAAGEKLLGYARHIVTLFDEMEVELQYTSEHPYMKVGATITVGACVLPQLIRRFEQKYPRYRADVYIDNTRVIEQKLIKSELDIGLVEGQVKSTDLIVRPVIQDELVLVCAPGDPLAHQNCVKAQELEGLPFILREQGSGTRELFEHYLGQHQIKVHEKWVCHSAEAIRNAVKEGQGISVISRRLVEHDLSQGSLVSVQLEGDTLTRDFCLIYHKNKFLSPALTQLIDTTFRQSETW